jgi:hypothetical protein
MWNLERRPWSAWLDYKRSEARAPAPRCRRATAEPTANVVLSEAMKTMPLALSQAVSMPPIYQAPAEGLPSLARRAS